MEHAKEMREAVERASFQMWQAYCNKKMECEDLQEQVETQAARIAELEQAKAHYSAHANVLVDESVRYQRRIAELEAQVKQLQREPLSDAEISAALAAGGVDTQTHTGITGKRTWTTCGSISPVLITRAIEAAHNIK